MGWKDIFRRNKSQQPEVVDAETMVSAQTPPEPAAENREKDTDTRLLAAKQRHREGHIEEADEVYRDILKNDPEHAATQHMIGIVFLQRGQLTEAEQCFRCAIAMDDQEADFHSNLGNALSAQNQIQEAYESFARALDLDPRHLVALSNAATALVTLGRSKEAKSCCQTILSIEPGDIDARLNLAAAHIEEHDTHAAIAILREGLEIQPDHIGLLVQLASALELVNQLDEASLLVQQAEAIQPGMARTALLTGLIARRQGKLEKAGQSLKAALKLGLAEHEKVEALNQLGLTLDAAGESADAFAAFQQSNQLMARIGRENTPNATAFLGDVAATRKFFTAEKFRALGEVFATDDDFEPVFFVGFPRSGTTLMEQVLKAHPGLTTTDEQSPLAAVIREIEDSIGEYPYALDQLTASDVDRLRQRFHDFCRDTIGELQDRQLVDKLPLNIVHMGFARLLFPRAKILVALRDPRDACFSCFMQKFEVNDAMASFLDLETTGMAYEAVMGLWLHYRSFLAEACMEYRYESLVEDFNDTVSQVLDFIGAGWHEDINSYRQAAREREISTPSYRDVTAPVNARALARWRRYEQELAPIFPRLKPFVEAFAYVE